MFKPSNSFKTLVYLIIVILAFTGITAAQKKSKESSTASKSVLWEQTNVGQKDLYLGPGGVEMRPDLSNITLVEKDKTGTNLKYRIKDGAGRKWVAKIGVEAQPETAAVRLVWALGYKSEINYLVPSLNIPNAGTFNNVRLEARPDNIKRSGDWDWKNNPFLNTNEFQGLKIMMAFINNWDLKHINNVILKRTDVDEADYAISDLGATFGNSGGLDLPLFWRIGRSKNNPKDYSKDKFIKGVKKGYLKINYVGKNKDIFNDITVENGRWLANLLNQLSDKQIADAFRAANYSPQQISLLTQTVRKRINDLNAATR